MPLSGQLPSLNSCRSLTHGLLFRGPSLQVGCACALLRAFLLPPPIPSPHPRRASPGLQLSFSSDHDLHCYLTLLGTLNLETVTPTPLSASLSNEETIWKPPNSGI